MSEPTPPAPPTPGVPTPFDPLGDLPTGTALLEASAGTGKTWAVGALVTRYVAEGQDVMIVTCTGGEAGSILNKSIDRPEVLENMAAIRREEMARAAEILGVRHRWLGFVDSGLPEGDPKPPLPEGCFALVDLDEATAPLVAELHDPAVRAAVEALGGYDASGAGALTDLDDALSSAAPPRRSST